MRTFSGLSVHVVLLLLVANAVADDQINSLPLHLRAPGQRVLVIAGGEELQGIVDVLNQYRIPFEQAESFDKNRQDYRDIFAIIVGSNRVDYFGSPENQGDEAFNSIDAFVRGGGHLFCFGAFNGRNFHHWKRFGFRTGSQHGFAVAYDSARADVFFNGLKDHLPGDGKLHLVGTLNVDAPHITMLVRSGTAAKGTPVLATVGVDAGRVSVLMAEPYYKNSMWILPPAIHWICRGAPTIEAQLNERPLVSPFVLRDRLRQSRVPLADERIRLLRTEFTDVHNADEFLVLAANAADKERQYVALQMAAEKYSGIPNASGVEGALLAAFNLYWFDLLNVKAHLLRQCEVNCNDEREAQDIARLSLNAFEDAMDAFRIPEAREFASIALGCANRSGKTHYVSLAEQALAKVEPIHRAWERVSETLVDHKAHPEDAMLNTSAGKFFAFVANDWDVGLACLVNGNDETLRDLAELSQLQTPSAIDKLRLADRWLNYARTLEGIERHNVERKVREYYHHIHENLSQLTDQDQQRVKEYLKLAPRQPANLSISFVLEGYGFFRIRQTEVLWETKAGAEPEVIYVGTQDWRPFSNPSLINRGATRFMPDNVDFGMVHVDKGSSRGVVRIESHTPEEVVIRVNDLPSGRGEYRLTVRFGASEIP